MGTMLAGGSGNATPWNYAAPANGISASSTAVTAATPPAGLRVYITSMQIQATALGNATTLRVRDGAGGATLWQVQLATTGLDLRQVTFDVPLIASTGNLVEFLTAASATGNVYVNMQGFFAP